MEEIKKPAPNLSAGLDQIRRDRGKGTPDPTRNVGDDNIPDGADYKLK
jgi:hypothetical protein